MQYETYVSCALGDRPGRAPSDAERLVLSLSFHGDNREFVSDGEPILPTSSHYFSAWAYGHQRSWSNDQRRLDAELIRRLCCDTRLRRTVTERGVTAIGGVLDRRLSLDYVDAGMRLAMMFCRFERGLSARGARFVRLCLRGCKLHSNHANARRDGPAETPDDSGDATALMLQGASIDGDLDLDSELQRGAGMLGDWPVRDHTETGPENRDESDRGDGRPDGLFVAYGVVRADGVRIGGRLTARRACFFPDLRSATYHDASLRLRQSRVGLDVILDDARFRNAGVDLRGIEVRGNLNLDRSDFRVDRPKLRDGTKHDRMVDAREAVIDGDLTLDGVEQLRGTVDFSRSHIKGKVSVCRSRLLKQGFEPSATRRVTGTNALRRIEVACYSVVGDNAEVGHDLRINGSTLEGGISTDDMRIGGYLKLVGSTLNRHIVRLPFPDVGVWPLTHAVHADRIIVGDDAAIGEPKRSIATHDKTGRKTERDAEVTRLHGQVTMRWCRIGGHLNLTRAEVTAARGKINALTASGGTIGGNVQMHPASRFGGSVRFVGSTIRGNVEIEGSRFDRLRDHDALSMRGATIMGDLRLGLCGGGGPQRKSPADDYRMRSNGTVSFADATVVGRVNVSAVVTSTTPLDRWPPTRGRSASGVGVLDHDNGDREAVSGAIHRLRGERRRLPSALSFRNAKLRSDVRFHPGCVVRGRVSFSGAELGGHLIFLGGDYRVRTRRDRVGWAKQPPREQMMPDAEFLTDRQYTENAEHEDAIRVLSATIDGRVYLGMDETSTPPSDHPMRVVGRVSFNASTIEGWLKVGHVEIMGVRYPQPAGRQPKLVNHRTGAARGGGRVGSSTSGGAASNQRPLYRWSLSASGATIRSGLYVSGPSAKQPARFIGEFRVRRATIYHEIDIDNAEFISVRPPVKGQPRDNLYDRPLMLPGQQKNRVLDDWLKPRGPDTTEQDWLKRIAPARTKPQDWSVVNFTRTRVIGIVRFKEHVGFRAPTFLPYIVPGPGPKRRKLPKPGKNSHRGGPAGQAAQRRDRCKPNRRLWQRVLGLASQDVVYGRDLRRQERLKKHCGSELMQLREFKRQRRWDTCWVRLDEMQIEGRLEWHPQQASLDQRQWEGWGLLMDEARVGTFNQSEHSFPGNHRLSISDFRYKHIFIKKSPDPTPSADASADREPRTASDPMDYIRWIDLQQTVSRRSFNVELLPKTRREVFKTIFLGWTTVRMFLLLAAATAAGVGLIHTYGWTGPPADPPALIWPPFHNAWWMIGLPAVVLALFAVFGLVFIGLVKWLERRACFGGEMDWLGFDSQPFEQLARVYRVGGEDTNYRLVTAEKTARQCRGFRRRSLRKSYLELCGFRKRPECPRDGWWERLRKHLAHERPRSGIKAEVNRFLQCGHWLISLSGRLILGQVVYRLWGVLSRYGTSMKPALLGLLFLWLLGVVIYEKNGLFDRPIGAFSPVVAPRDPYTYMHAPDEYPAYSSWMFSADNILPIIELGSANHWVVNRSAGRAFTQQLEYTADHRYPSVALPNDSKDEPPPDSQPASRPAEVTYREEVTPPAERSGLLNRFMPQVLQETLARLPRGGSSPESVVSPDPIRQGGINSTSNIDTATSQGGSPTALNEPAPEQDSDRLFELLGRPADQPLDALRPDLDYERRAYIPEGQRPPTMLNFSWRDYDEPTLKARWLSLFQKLQIALGWALTTIAVLGYTGLIRRD